MKKKTLIVLGILILISQIFIIIYTYNNDNKNEFSNDYMAVFKNETGERVYSTYLYVDTKGKKGKKKKKKYRYINTISTLSGYDSTNWNEEIVKKDKLKKRKKIFEIAKEHNAYSYVIYEDGKIYSIEEFKEMLK